MTQPDLYRLFDEFRAIHEHDADDTLYDAVLDAMDFIGGWYSSSCRLYDTDYPPNGAEPCGGVLRHVVTDIRLIGAAVRVYFASKSFEIP